MRCRVIKKHESSFPDPLILKEGEKVQIEHKKTEWSGWIWSISNSGNKGWVPESYLKIAENTAELVENYNATELNAEKGQLFQILKEVSDWVWVTSNKGKSGWIPKENVELIID